MSSLPKKQRTASLVIRTFITTWMWIVCSDWSRGVECGAGLLQEKNTEGIRVVITIRMWMVHSDWSRGIVCQPVSLTANTRFRIWPKYRDAPPGGMPRALYDVARSNVDTNQNRDKFVTHCLETEYGNISPLGLCIPLGLRPRGIQVLVEIFSRIPFPNSG